MDVFEPMLELLRARLKGRRAVLGAVSLVLLVFWSIASLSAPEALGGFGFIVLAALLLPHGIDGLDGEGHRLALEDGLDAPTMVHFADALADPCLILDARALVVHTNPPAARQFPGTVPGNPIAFSLRNPSLLAAIERARKTGVSQAIELHQTVPTETWHKVVVSPVGTRTGEMGTPHSLVVTLQNLTEAKRVDAMRSDFIANASHELRTPLTSLVGFIDTLLGPAARDAKAREKFLAIMQTQAARMSKLIDDLLSLSRIEMRQHVRPTDSVELVSLLDEVRDGLMTQARDSALEIVFDHPSGEALVTGDRDELYEVFENLLDNAIKYGGDGDSIEIMLRPLAARPGYDYAITITDHGVGIESAHVPRLTERFYRVEVESSHRKKGTGLGLAIVKHTLNRHHGLLTIKSEPGIGTRVEVLLPK